jgi:Flp pilus assembly protein TadG
MREAFSDTGARRGIALLSTVLSMSLIIPALGLGIDASMLYLVKGKLETAVDAAAAATARSMEADGKAPEDVAQRFFRANFPEGFLATRQTSVRVEVFDAGAGRRMVVTRASVEAPCYFMRILGFQSVPVKAQGKTLTRSTLL